MAAAVVTAGCAGIAVAFSAGGRGVQAEQARVKGAVHECCMNVDMTVADGYIYVITPDLVAVCCGVSVSDSLRAASGSSKGGGSSAHESSQTTQAGH